MLEVRDLSVQYGAVSAVRGVSLRVGKGEVVGLIGPNGAGKSTILHTIMGMVPSVSGDVQLHGETLTGVATERIVRSGVALVPEGRRIFGHLTVRENLRLGTFARRQQDGVAADLSWVFELFPVLEEFGERRAGVLSGGQQQMLAIARALLAKPDVVLLDEPSLGLAPSFVDAVFGALERLRDAGATLLLVEQRAQRTVRFANRTHVLSNGEIRLTLTPADAGDSEAIARAYFRA